MRTRFEAEAQGNLEMSYNNSQYTAAQRTNQNQTPKKNNLCQLCEMQSIGLAFLEIT